MVGEEKPASIIGDVATTSAAFEAGFRSGDQILSINGKEVSFWEEVKETLEKTSGETLEFSVKRFSLSGDGPVEKVSAPTKLVGNTNVLSLESLVGDVPGLELSAVASRVGVAFDSAAYKAGMRPMDIVSSVNGVAVSRWFELEAAFSMVSTTDPTVIEVKRGEGDKEETLKFTFVPTSGNLADSGIEVPELYLAGVEEKSPAEESGIKPGDKIVSISGTTVSKWEELTKVVRSYKEDQGPFEVVVNREGQDKTFKITPTSKSVTSRTGSREEIFALGVHMGVALAIPNLKLYRHANPVMALSRGAYDTWNWSKITVISFIRLIQGKVSARSLGGPLMIGQLAKSAFDIGISAFLKIMAIISINLFILNLLPIPVLDGGHLVFFSIEALRGAPMSMRKMEIAQQIGVVLLFGMMALAIFNDVGRLFE
jgi:regulator of sigma E protease